MSSPTDAGCVFCRIIDGEAPASIAHDDAQTLAFMDLRQVSQGHTLVVPKQHVQDIFGLDDATGAALMATVARVARAVRAAFACDGITIWQSNGAAAGQEVPHLHVHVVARSNGDGLLQVYPARPGPPSRDELDEQARRIAAAKSQAP